MTRAIGEAPEGLVHALEIACGDVRATVLTLGAIVFDLRVKGRSVTLGADTLEPYLGPMAYFGAIVGRVANRIAGAKFELDGQLYSLDANEPNGNCLHGGADGAAHKVWQVLDHDAAFVTLGVTLPDGHMGFPGALNVSATYRATNEGLSLTIKAIADAPTLCSFAPHSYFNLDGSGSAEKHALHIVAEEYLPLSDINTPLGSPASVEGTKFDFRSPRALGNSVIDHNFCLSATRQPLRPVAWLRGADLEMELATTEPGVQIYTGAHLGAAPVQGRDGVLYGASAGVAMEPQAWPDAPNNASYPSIILRPGETYCAETEYRFRWLDSTT